MKHHVVTSVCALALWLAVLPLQAEEATQHETLALASGEEIGAEVFGLQTGDAPRLRILWIGPGFGIHERHHKVAQGLAQQGAEVWLVDLAEALFLTRGAEAMREIPGAVVADIIEALGEGGRHRVLVMSSSYGAIPTVRGIHAWQSRGPQQGYLLGAVLFTPYFFSHVPQLGEEPSFVPEMYATSAPVYIFQAAKNGNRWHVPAMAEGLRRHAPVYTELLKGVTSLFYREDNAQETLAAVEAIPRKVMRAVKMLSSNKMPLTALALASAEPAEKSHGLDAELKPYRGVVQAAPIALTDINGRAYDIRDYRGKVTLINFWASWCRPCVEEIPSLNRLKEKMQGQPFELISVNYAEAPEQIRAFMQKVNVDFPVLVDPEGELAGKWKVVVFPSTFVIAPDGQIRYGVNAGLYWDNDTVVRQLQELAAGG